MPPGRRPSVHQERPLQIAKRWSVSIKTVEYHRARLMEKTGASSVAELVVIALQQARAGTA